MAPPGLRADADLLVLGGGPAGLGAAHRAAQAGHRVVLCEAAPRVGGAAGSFSVAGVRVDFGSHRLHPSIDPAVLAELRTLLGDDLQRRPRRGRIRLAGRWIQFPLRASDLLRRLPPSFALGAARDAATSWARRPRADTFAEVLRAGLGPTLCERFYFPYARKVWGLPPQQLSAEQARRRVGANTPGKLLARLRPAPDDERRTFFYPRSGFGAISESLAAAARQAGADVRLNAPVARLELGASHVTATTGCGDQVRAPRVWSTLPLTVLAGLTDPQPPAAVRRAAASLSFRSMVLVYLVLPVDRFSPYDAHYLPELATPVTRVSEPKNYRDGDDPPGHTVLCAELPCDRDDPVWRADDAELARIVSEGLRASGLTVPAPVEVATHRLAHAYPVCRRGFEQALDVLDGWASSVPRLLTFGRQGLFVHDNTHHALAMAWAATAALGPAGTFDEQAWARARQRFTAHVVED